MIANTTERAKLLIEQNRFKEAEKELRRSLSENPNDADCLCLLSICKCEEEQYKEAVDLIRAALSLEPANPFMIYVYAKILYAQENYQEAEKIIKEAIRLDPHNADFFGLLASVYLNRKDWDKALHYANQGLQAGPDNITCLNIRSTALLKLNRKVDSFDTISDALNYDPENAFTHANMGWGMLERGDHKKALEHFRKSLQANPGSEFAKSGMVEALKARYLPYRLFLRYAFWIGNMQGKAQWGVLIGFYLGSRVLRGIADSVPQLRPVIMPFVFAYVLFAVSTWIIAPVSNLFLRLNVYGRYALSRSEIITSNFIGVAFLTGIVAFAAWLFLQEDILLFTAIFGISMMVPFAGMLSPDKKNKRIILICYSAVLVILGIAGLLLLSVESPLAVTLGITYLVGVFIYQWVANALLTK